MLTALALLISPKMPDTVGTAAPPATAVVVPNPDGSFPPPPKGLPRPAWPVVNPAKWVTMADYPSVALRNSQSGSVRFRVNVDSTGRVSDCVIVESAGVPALDEAACKAVMARARFTPALDRRGKPTTGTYQNAIRWVIPRDMPRPGPSTGEAVMSMTVNEDGTMSECRVEKAAEGIMGPLGSRACGTRKMLPYRDGAGNPVKRKVVTSIKVEVLPVD